MREPVRRHYLPGVVVSGNGYPVDYCAVIEIELVVENRVPGRASRK